MRQTGQPLILTRQTTDDAVSGATNLESAPPRLHIPARILRIPVFSVPIACFHRNLNFRSTVILFFGIKRSKNLRSKTKASGQDHGA
jgi:hypothetical protein